MYGACTNQLPYLMVLEYAPNGDLKQYLEKKAAKHYLSFEKLISISQNVSDVHEL